MRQVANGLRASVVAALVIVLLASAGRLQAASCAQPDVSFTGGRLTVISKGCSMQQVLKAVSEKTGIEIVTPPSASSAPVFAAAGPGEPARVITELLDGSPYNSTLTAKADGSGSLVKVVLTDRVAFVPDKPAVAPKQATPAPSGHAAGTQVAARSASGAHDADSEKKKRTVDPDTVASVEDSSLPKPRREIDEDTLKKLPKLPQGVPTAMWQLYPGLVDNGGVVPSGPPLLPNGRPAPLAAGTVGNPAINPAQLQSALLYSYDPAFAPKGVVGLPELPPNIDPNIGKLYPWNLMQLIQGPIQLPNLHLPPMAKPIPNP